MLARRTAAFTIPELLAGMGIAAMIAAGTMAFLYVSSRLSARNLAVNHSHLTVRQAHQSLSHKLHQAYSAFRLINCASSTTFTDVNAVSTSEVDPATGLNVSTIANGVRFRALVGGPFKLGANVDGNSKSLTFSMADSPSSDYVPEAGDKIFIPLIRRELDIAAVTSTPGPGNSTFSVTTSEPIAYEFANTGASVTAAYFFRKAAFTVFENKLRFHKRFPGTSADIVEVCSGVTSEKPFSFFCPGGSPDDLKLRVSLEAYDHAYSSQAFQGGTITLHTMITPRTPPNLLVQTN